MVEGQGKKELTLFIITILSDIIVGLFLLLIVGKSR